MNKSILWWILGMGVAIAMVVLVNRSLHRVERGVLESSARTAQRAQQQQAERAARQRADVRARTLASDQQCVAGTVVTVRPNYASQLLQHGQTVACKGRLAEVPIR